MHPTQHDRLSLGVGIGIGPGASSRPRTSLQTHSAGSHRPLSPPVSNTALPAIPSARPVAQSGLSLAEALSHGSSHHHHYHGSNHGSSHSSNHSSTHAVLTSSTSHHYSHPQPLSRSSALAPTLPLVINTKLAPVAALGANALFKHASPSAGRRAPNPSLKPMADFAAHLVCYMLYGRRTTRPPTTDLHGSLPSPVLSPAPSPTRSYRPCAFNACSGCCAAPIADRPFSPGPRPSTVPLRTLTGQDSPQTPPTGSLSLSDDLVQPKPMFLKYCLDVLSATVLSTSAVLLALRYIQKLIINLRATNKVVNTGEGAEYRFLTGALMLANKFLDDNTFTNKTWADITGMKVKDLNLLESQFLTGLEFRLFTSTAEFHEWLANLVEFTSLYMPSQYSVAYQQQQLAFLTPVSPSDQTATGDATTVAPETTPIIRTIDIVSPIAATATVTTTPTSTIRTQIFPDLPYLGPVSRRSVLAQPTLPRPSKLSASLHSAISRPYGGYSSAHSSPAFATGLATPQSVTPSPPFRSAMSLRRDDLESMTRPVTDLDRTHS
ncbi:hypothetical protein BGW38_005057, partial [Lunasporangiospora selenospora]